jgi:hypothetical protein
MHKDLEWFESSECSNLCPLFLYCFWETWSTKLEKASEFECVALRMASKLELVKLKKVCSRCLARRVTVPFIEPRAWFIMYGS